jgi:hypothetical protein
VASEIAQALERGCVVSDARNDPAAAAESFVARILVLNHPGTIQAGYCPVVDVHTAHVACKFSRLLSRQAKGSKEVVQRPAHLQAGDAVVAFSRRDVLMLRDQVSDNGKSVSVIYGALPPEVRHVLIVPDADEKPDAPAGKISGRDMARAIIAGVSSERFGSSEWPASSNSPTTTGRLPTGQL